MRTTRLLPIPAAALTCLIAVGTAAASVTHTVRRGETLTSIATADGLSVSRLAAANGLSSTAQLISGRELVIPAQGGAVAAASAADPSEGTEAAAPVAPASSGGFLVARGDTLSAIAARYGTSVGALAAANGMSPDGVLLTGRTLTIPSAGAASQSAPEPVATTARPAPAPVATMVTPSAVGSIAAEAGVPPALAEAVADQESGFNDAMVSRTGATGVMQIEPGTWRDLHGAGGQSLAASSALDNIRGGVALLHDLLAQTGGNESEAVAAYYQGLRSVQTRGIYPGTQRYVRDVLALQSRF